MRDDAPAPPAPYADYTQPSFTSAPSATGWVTPRVKAVAGAQKLVIYAIALYLLAIVLNFGAVAAGESTTGTATAVSGLVSLLLLGTLVLGLIGVYRLAAALGYSMGIRVLCLVLMFVPLAGVIMLLVLNSRATTLLRAAGVKVGFFGARV